VTAVIDGTRPAEAATDAPNDHLAADGELQRLTIEFDYANASLALNAITDVDQIHKLPTVEEIRHDLLTSYDFADMYFHLRDGELPSDDKRARKILLEAEDFVFEDGLLWHLRTPRTRKLDRTYSVIKTICLPERFRKKMAHVLHNQNCHVGIDRTYAAARLKYFYPGQYTYLRKHILSCETCQKAKENTHPLRAPITDLGLTVLGHKWNADIHGSFTQTSSNNAYVLVFVEQVSLWTEFYPLSEITADAIVQAFLDCVVSRYGAVKQLCLISDRRSAFTSQLMQTVTKTFHVTQILTAPYKHNQNQPAEII
jgi:hypothetical protein